MLVVFCRPHPPELVLELTQEPVRGQEQRWQGRWQAPGVVET